MIQMNQLMQSTFDERKDQTLVHHEDTKGKEDH